MKYVVAYFGVFFIYSFIYGQNFPPLNTILRVSDSHAKYMEYRTDSKEKFDSIYNATDELASYTFLIFRECNNCECHQFRNSFKKGDEVIKTSDCEWVYVDSILIINMKLFNIKVCFSDSGYICNTPAVVLKLKNKYDDGSTFMLKHFPCYTDDDVLYFSNGQSFYSFLSNKYSVDPPFPPNPVRSRQKNHR